MARRTCPACSSALIQWCAAVDLPFFADNLADRKEAVHMIELFGGDAEAWRCGHCGNFGAFGPDEFLY